MEKWKIGVIAALILGLGGYGLYQQQARESPFAPTANAAPDKNTNGNPVSVAPQANKAAGYIGQTLGSAQLPEWNQIGPWQNTPQAVTMSSLKGKPALVEFFRINCSHCQEAAPFLERLYQRYQPRGLKMVAVQSPIDVDNPENPENNWQSVKDWAKAVGLTYPIALDPKSKYFQKTINGQFYPTTMVTDASGKVVYAHTGHTTETMLQLSAELEKQFPGPGSVEQRAQSLARFLQGFVIGQNDDKMFDLLHKDVLKRLQS